MNVRLNLSLRSKFALIGSGAILLAILTVVTVSGHIFRESYTEALESRSVAVARSLALQLERIVQLGIRPTELSGFDVQLSEAANAYEGIAWAVLATQDGNVIAHSTHAHADILYSNAELMSALRAGRAQVIDTQDKGQDIHVALAPVRTPSDFTPVVVGVALDSTSLQRDILRLQIAGWAAGLMALVAGAALLIFATTRYITRPISSFVATMARIRKGGVDLSLRAKRRSDDEFGVMVDGFNTLLDQLAQRDAALVHARQTADAANRAKSQFLATVSHELRTPMHAILGMNELLLRTELNSKQQRFASTVHHSAKTLLEQINDILDFSKIEAGRMELEARPFNVRQLVENVASLMSAQAQRVGLDLAWRAGRALPEELVGDAGRITQMLTNLVGNALKFTQKGGVLIEVVPDGERVRFIVNDTGIGVDPAQVPQLFEPFRQADNTFARRYGGSGLGLAIVKELAIAMGGDAGGTGTPGAGSSFWFNARLLQQSPPPAPPVLDPSTPRLLISADLPMTSRAILLSAREHGLRAEELPHDGEANHPLPVSMADDALLLVASRSARHYLAELATQPEQASRVIVLGFDLHDSNAQACPVMALPLNTSKLFARIAQLCTSTN